MPNQHQHKFRKTCLWCHQKYLATKLQKFCTHEHHYAYRMQEQKVYKQYDYQCQKRDAELAKLEKQGMNYKLPPREVD